MMKRPELNKVKLPAGFPEKGEVYITMSKKQWDGALQAAYNAGFWLLELDKKEQIIAVYKKENQNKEVRHE